MTALPHLTRRGDVFYWRRKTRRLSTGIIDILVSLRTTNRSIAIKIARRLSHVSEEILDAIVEQRITAEEARSFLRRIVIDETAKLQRQYLQSRLDPRNQDTSGDERHDWAHKAAWSLLSDQGINAVLKDTNRGAFEASGRDLLDLDTLETTLEMLRKELQSEAHANRRATLFEESVGRRPIGAAERLEILQLFIAGKNAAHANFDPSAPSRLAEQVASEVDPVKIAYQTIETTGTDQEAVPGLMPEDSTKTSVQPVSTQADVAPKDAEAHLSDATPSHVHPPEPAEPEDPGSTTFDAVLERMLNMRRNGDRPISKKTATQYRTFAELLKMVTGKTDVRHLKQANLARMVEVLLALPKSYGKRPTDATKPIDDVLEEARALPKTQVGMSPGTVNRYIVHFAALINAAKDQGIEITEEFRFSSLRRREVMRAIDKKRTFKTAELKEFFQHRYWTDPGTKGKKLPPLAIRRRSGLYWVPLICAYTGARREEIAALTPGDYKCEDGVPFLHITETEVRSVKSLPSRRKLPLHKDLIDLGLPGLIEEAQTNKQRLLFPDLKEPSSDILGRKVGRYMERFVDEIWGPDGDGLTLHSMRHHAKFCWSRDKTVSEDVRRALMGHEGKDVHDRVYGTHLPIEDLLYGINQLPSVIGDLPKYLN